MKIILLTSLLLVAIQAAPQSPSINIQLNEEWETYKHKFNKKYDSLSELSRRIIWEENLQYIQQHNLEYDLGKHSYTLAVNEFADVTTEEFNTRFLSRILIQRNATGSTFIAPENVNDLPLSVDWRKRGYVTPVKNQDLYKTDCGSCYAFSATGALEGQYFRKTKKLVGFSEQQIVDCSLNFGNNGCDGGYPSNCLDYIEKYGIEAETSYKYNGKEGECRYNKSKVVTKCKDYSNIESQNEDDLAKAVAHVGPISVAIDANQHSFHSYSDGIYDEPNCTQNKLNHAVLVVGYGSKNGKNFWIVKNSWGTKWGRDGYILMTKDKNNQCGIASLAIYPLI